MANNTIRLLKGYEITTTEKARRGGTIWGMNAEPEELGRWSIEDEDEARKALGAHRCTYEYETRGRGTVELTEYGLEYFEADEDGEFVSGSDYDLAPAAAEWDK